MRMTFGICLLVVMAMGVLYPVRALPQQIDAPVPGDSGPAWIAVARGVVEPTGGLVRLASQREGLITSVSVEEGDRVTKGQELARIDDTAAKAQLRISDGDVVQAELQLQLAQMKAENAAADFRRLAPLRKADALPRRQIDEARRNNEMAQLELKVSQQAIELARQRREGQVAEVEARVIFAPADGIIVRRSARPGDATSTSTVTEMFLLAPAGPRVLRAQLDEQFVGLVEPGQQAEILRERDDGSRLTGTVKRVASVFGGAASANGGAAQGGQRSDEARTLEISIQLDGPQDQIDKLVLGQRMIARIKK